MSKSFWVSEDIASIFSIDIGENILVYFLDENYNIEAGKFPDAFTWKAQMKIKSLLTHKSWTMLNHDLIGFYTGIYSPPTQIECIKCLFFVLYLY